MPLPARADVAIVGGGITGTALACELARAGAAVVLLERDRIAAGPTGRSTALVRVHYSQPVLVQMAVHGLERYSASPETTGFVRTGVLWVVGHDDEEALRANVALVRAAGGEVEALDPAALADVESRLSLDGIAAACWEPGSGYCDPYGAAAGFAAAASAAGATIAEGACVDAVEPGVVRVDGHPLAADRVVVAAGPWSVPLLEPLGYELPVVAVRAQVGRFRIPAGFGPPPPAVADLGPLQFYAKGAEGDYLEVGTLDPGHTADPIDPDACPEGADADTLDAFRRSLVTRFPGLAGGHWRGAWSGVYDVTPDWQPAIGGVPGADGVYVAAGFSGHGFKLAPAVAVALAGLVDRGEWERFDLGLFDPGRFARGELVSSRYGYSVVG
ncbi:MAG: NAD(P)/FAD-dependent oxidoreductase [Gaiellaceae bacterium]